MWRAAPRGQKLEKRRSVRALHGDAARDGPRRYAALREGPHHRPPDAFPASRSVEAEERRPASADRDAKCPGAAPRLHNPVEPGNEPRAVGHMVHVFERFGQEFEAARRESVPEDHRPGGVLRGAAKRNGRAQWREPTGSLAWCWAVTRKCAFPRRRIENPLSIRSAVSVMRI